MKMIHEPKLKIRGPIVSQAMMESLLPPEYNCDLWSDIVKEVASDDRLLIILDDDPTGCQTVHGVSLCLDYSLDTLRTVLDEEPRILFIVSNSRSLWRSDMVQRISMITENIRKVCEEKQRKFLLVSRSDSTLRGHYPIETDIIKRQLFGDSEGATDVLIPAFFEGNRVTAFDSHWIVQGGSYIPVGQTEFARDPLFGYKYSHLPRYVREKFSGYAEMPDCATISLEDLRLRGPEYVRDRLLSVEQNTVVIVNAVTYSDMEVFVLGALWAERAGFVPMYRSGASFVRVRAAVPTRKYLTAEDISSSAALTTHGGLVLVGSYTNLASSQLHELVSRGIYTLCEIPVPNVVVGTAKPAVEVAAQLREAIAAGQTVVCFTSRRFKRLREARLQWHIMEKLTSYFRELVEALTAEDESMPRFIVTKGGLTAYEVARRALHVQSCRVLGQILPGVSVWEIPVKSHRLPYLVFPGNVGTHTSLREAVEMFL
ncbi:MAG TPA: four-carbon acid sugar kinase family protein [Ktedonobacteraceae bacterium]|nr:four-carbon acid sugar kinase family protein [Ktedonobacteraceae bacterium]